MRNNKRSLTQARCQRFLKGALKDPLFNKRSWVKIEFPDLLFRRQDSTSPAIVTLLTGKNIFWDRATTYPQITVLLLESCRPESECVAVIIDCLIFSVTTTLRYRIMACTVLQGVLYCTVSEKANKPNCP